MSTYIIHGFAFASSSFKPLIVAEELGADYEFKVLDPQKGEHKTEEHLARHPLGKVPTLTHGDKTLFESAAICKYLAVAEKSELYPAGDFERAIVDQWIDFFSLHLGRWINALYFENVIKGLIGLEVDPKAIEEAVGFCKAQAEAVNQHLQANNYLCGANLTIADLFAYAYMRLADAVGFALDDYPALSSWRDKLKARPAVAKAETLVRD